jgi:hypothetical protein
VFNAAHYIERAIFPIAGISDSASVPSTWIPLAKFTGVASCGEN